MSKGDEDFKNVLIDLLTNPPDGVKIVCPESDTNIKLNVSGKSAEEIGYELMVLANIFHAMAKNDIDDSFMLDMTNAPEEMKKCRPFPILEYSEHGGKYVYDSNSMVSGYFIDDDFFEVKVCPSFAEWARSGKPLNDFCKANLNHMLRTVKK